MHPRPLSSLESNITGDNYTQGFQFTSNPSGPLVINRFTSGSTPERRDTPFREVYQMVNTLSSNYVTSGAMTWNDVLSRVSTSAVVGYKLGVTPTVFAQLESGVKTGIKLFEVPFNRINPRFNPDASLLGEVTGQEISQCYSVDDELPLGGRPG